ncbi:MAG: hypothetical protein ACRD3F_00835 [Acidobacteriaceae bacterium]
MKTNDDRLDGVLDYIRKNFQGSLGLMEQKISELGARKSAVASALSLGSRSGTNTPDETERRNGIRTALFLAFTEGKQPLALAESFKTKYSNMNAAQVKLEIKGRLPVMSSSPNRADWHPTMFTPVQPTPQIQTAPTQFRYMVFGMMNAYTGRGTSFESILAKPAMLKAFMLSTSAIDESHKATYYPYGFILMVPEENFVSTSTSDQAFKNYRAEDPLHPLKPFEKTDNMSELQRVAGTYGFLSRQEVLSKTKATGSTGYNEVVVLGTGPTGRQIDVRGFFMKVDSKGNRFERPSMNPSKREGTFVTDDIFDKMKKTGLPIVKITDDSGAGA